MCYILLKKFSFQFLPNFKIGKMDLRWVNISCISAVNITSLNLLILEVNIQMRMKWSKQLFYISLE